jgi:copper chaperone
MDTIKLKVEGMTCSHCEMTVRKALLDVKGVKEASVSHERDIAEVKYKSGKVSVEDLVNAVNASGYKAIAA